MNDLTLERLAGRGGELACSCDLPGSEGSADRILPLAELVPLAAANGFAVLAQALTLAVIPVAGVQLAPASTFASLPFVALLIGAGLGTLPAAFLTLGPDRIFGFGLGASLGIAGGVIAAWALASGHFSGLILGALWIGIAQGFAAFYRHGAATRSGSQLRSLAIIIGAGAMSGVTAPAITELARTFAGPMMTSAMILAAAGAYLIVLACNLALPRPVVRFVLPSTGTAGLGRIVVATLIAASAWFVMASVMSGGPLRMADCGIGAAGISGLISWHLIAMYGPALGLAPLLRQRTCGIAAALGIVSLLGAFAVLLAASAPAHFAAALVIAGSGWAVSMVAATAILHSEGTPARLVLATHDGLILLAAVGGAILGGALH